MALNASDCRVQPAGGGAALTAAQCRSSASRWRAPKQGATRINSQHILKRLSIETEVPRLDADLDDALSMRPLELDAAGYFLIKLDREGNRLIAEHYTNTINKQGELRLQFPAPAPPQKPPLTAARRASRPVPRAGMACDPDTGEVIPCTPGYTRPAKHVYT
jgi:hypothetical protein